MNVDATVKFTIKGIPAGIVKYSLETIIANALCDAGVAMSAKEIQVTIPIDQARYVANA